MAEVFSITASLALIFLGLAIIVAALRIAAGPADAYNSVRSVSKGVLTTIRGEINQPEGRNSIVYNRGIAYRKKPSGDVEFLLQAKVNQDAIGDASR